MKELKAKRLGRPPSRAERATQTALHAEARPPSETDPLPVSTFPGAKRQPLDGQLALTDDVA